MYRFDHFGWSLRVLGLGATHGSEIVHIQHSYARRSSAANCIRWGGGCEPQSAGAHAAGMAGLRGQRLGDRRKSGGPTVTTGRSHDTENRYTRIIETARDTVVSDPDAGSAARPGPGCTEAWRDLGRRLIGLLGVVVLAGCSQGGPAGRTSSATSVAHRAARRLVRKRRAPADLHRVPQLDLGPDVECGYLTVPQNRADPNSRKIKLAVVTRKTASPDPKPEPACLSRRAAPVAHRWSTTS